MSWFTRNKNTKFTTQKTIVSQMEELRPLPMGQTEFMEWSDRIISGALIPCEDPDSLRAALAAMVMQLPATESHKPDAYFIHSLRKAAANEVAHANFQAIKRKKDDLAQAEQKKKADAALVEDAKKVAAARESNLNNRK